MEILDRKSTIIASFFTTLDGFDPMQQALKNRIPHLKVKYPVKTKCL